METKLLENWFVENNIENKSINSFWKYFNSFKKNDVFGFDDSFSKINEKLIELYVRSIKYVISLDGGGEYIDIITNINYNGRRIGDYTTVYTEDGELTDSFLFLKDDNYTKKIVAVNNKGIYIAKKLLKKGLEPIFIAEITGLKIDFISSLIKNIQGSK